MEEKMESDAMGATSESPPSPPPPRKLNRRSSVAIARRLSRMSAVGALSLDEQLELLPAADEEMSDVRLNKVLNLCLRVSVRGVEQRLRDEDDSEDLEAIARKLSNNMCQKDLFTAEELAEMATQLDSSVLTVQPDDLLSCKQKALKEYTEKLAKEENDWNALLQERKEQYKNARVNLLAAEKGKIKVDDTQKFSLNPEEKAFFTRLPDAESALAQLKRHEERQALLATSLGVAAKRLKAELEEMERELTIVGHSLSEQARGPAPEDVRDLLQ